MNGTTPTQAGTAPDWRKAAAEFGLSAVMYNSLADQASHYARPDLGHLAVDYGIEVARAYRELARISTFYGEQAKALADAARYDSTTSGALTPCAGDCPDEVVA